MGSVSRGKTAMRKPAIFSTVIGISILAVMAWIDVRALAQRYLNGITWPEPVVVTPGEGSQPPSDAIVLFDGKNFDAWDGAKGWQVDPDGPHQLKSR